MVHHVTISDQIQFDTIQILENHRHYVQFTNHRSFVYNIRFDSSYRTGSLRLKVLLTGGGGEALSVRAPYIADPNQRHDSKDSFV